ncbi:MAG: arabinose isomerase, partial [bacterium]|nr:arabinose isomerase [bacterium]
LSSALRALRTSRIGLLGHVYEGMLDMNSDPTVFDAVFGMHTVHLETGELKARIHGASAAEIKVRKAEIGRLFHFPGQGSDPVAGPVSEEMLELAARTSVGLDKLVDDFNLNGLSYYFHGRGDEAYEEIAGGMVVGNSLLTARGVPVAGEYDLKTCTAMLIMDRMGIGGSFAELHPVDFDNDFVLVGHDGPHHMAIAEGKPVLRGLSVFHGKTGKGPSVEFQIKNGPITVLGVTLSASGRIRLVAAEGESLPGPIPATGNTNTRGSFKPDVRTFLERWAAAGTTHHFALGIGSKAGDLEKLAEVLSLEYICIT